MLRILRRERGVLALVDGRGEIGWATPGTLGFGGYHAASDAAYDALLAHDAAAAHLRRAGRPLSSPPPSRTLTTTREGGRDWIRVGGVPIALLLAPSGTSRAGPCSYGFELLVPPELVEDARIRLARQVHAALQPCALQSAVARRDRVPHDDSGRPNISWISAREEARVNT
jgi:hypothetical protein